MMNTKFHFGVSVEEMDPISRKVYEGLKAGESKKVLANRYKMPISTVNAISKRFRTGQAVDTVPAFSVYNATVQEPENEKVRVLDVAEPEISEICEEIKSQKKKRFLTDEEKETIQELFREGYTGEEVADLLGVSLSTVYRIKNKKPKTEKKQKRATPALVQLSQSNIRVGLVADRHIMPVNDYIFKSALDESLMFDYDKIESICLDYITDMIDFDAEGNAEQSLTVYVTGIQCVLSSLIKVTNEMRVNLTLRHYDSKSDSYHTHVIWDKFSKVSLPASISEMLVNSKNSYTYKCDVKELIENKTLIKVAKVYQDADCKTKYQDIILCKDTSCAFEVMQDVLNNLDRSDRTQKIAMFASGYDYKNEKFVKNGIDIKLNTEK